MPEDKPEIEKSETRVIQANEWFTPFESYDEIPYSPDSDEKFRSKFSMINFGNIYQIRIGIRWNQDAIENSFPLFSRFLILPNTNKVLNDHELPSEQKKIESRIMTISMGEKVDRFTGKEIVHPYLIEVKTPCGEILINQLADEVSSRLSTWKSRGGTEANFLAVPEIANIINKIQMRFIPWRV